MEIMVSSPEVRQGALPPGFLVEREVEPVGRSVLLYDEMTMMMVMMIDKAHCLLGSSLKEKLNLLAGLSSYMTLEHFLGQNRPS